MKGTRRKLVVLGLGAVGLAGALTLAAFVAPSRNAAAAATYVPTDGAQVIARVPVRDAGELAARRSLASSPERVELAVELARADIRRYRAESDPRYLGRAQATLARWWDLAEPPADVLLVRATIRQSLHDFTGARGDLDRLVALRPDDAQAHLTRAVVATVSGDYVRARESCAAAGRMLGMLVAASCDAPLDGIAGHADTAYARLSTTLAQSRRAARELRGWALTALAELAIMRGQTDAAALHLRAALALDADDTYARNLLADVLLATHHAAEVSSLLAGRESVDSHLVRLAIAEHQTRGARETATTRAMRERIEAAALRGDRVHLREEAMFALAVESDAPRALKLARDNWNVQKELADARLLAETAVAANDPDAAAPVIAWARKTSVRDAWLERSLTQLGVTR
ncbi:MAG TPA: hypothetical protein VIU61_04925 [Kofleriaceae bacterium]